MVMNGSSDNPNIPDLKKPYEKPSFPYEEVFVTTALQCGKVTGGSGNPCHQHKKS